MSQPTSATLFSGGEIAGVGIRAAGFRHIWGIEYDNAIADVARANGFDTITADILDVDPHDLEPPDYLHASPVCTRASQANHSAELNDENTRESPLDIAMAEKIAQFIDVTRPPIFTLENVYGYRNFKAFGIIISTLSRNGYMWDYDNLNSADFGVPQTRCRLVLRAVRDSLLPNLPPPTEWIGWYAAIEDLIPTLPASKFAPWQLVRLPMELKTFLINPTRTSFKWQQASDCIDINQPAPVIMSGDLSLGKYRAFIVDGQTSGNGEGVTVRRGDAPAFVMSASQDKRWPKAFFVNGSNTSHLTIAYENEPSFSVVSQPISKDDRRAFLSSGRVVSMTPRALARFQSIPDDYILPDKTKLACKIIGNGWPSLMAQRIAEGLRDTLI